VRGQQSGGALGDFGKLFIPNGIIDEFFSPVPCAIRIRRDRDWVCGKEIPSGRALSPETLSQKFSKCRLYP